MQLYDANLPELDHDNTRTFLTFRKHYSLHKPWLSKPLFLKCLKRLDFKLQLNNDSFVLRLYPVFYRSNGYLLLGFGAIENHDSRKMEKKKK